MRDQTLGWRRDEEESLDLQPYAMEAPNLRAKDLHLNLKVHPLSHEL